MAYHAGVKSVTREWVRYAEADLKAAPLALEHDLLRICLFHCHEAVEKMLKAIWVETRGEEPERTHNLPYLARELAIEMSDSQSEFLRRLYWELIPSRYPEGREPDRRTVQWYYEETRGLFSWLRQMLK